MRGDELPQQVSGHYGTCFASGHPSECPACAQRWAEENDPIVPTSRGRSRIVLLLETPADPERPTLAEIERGIEL